MTYSEDFKNGEIVQSRSGDLYRIKRVRTPRQCTEFIEPVYRLQSLQYGSTGNQEWTHEELQALDVTPAFIN